MSESMIERMARAVKECTDEFSSPVCFYVEGEAKRRWQKAHPEWLEPDGPDWCDQPENRDGLIDYKIIADAVLTALESAGYVIVPREPTEAMLLAARKACRADEIVARRAEAPGVIDIEITEFTFPQEYAAAISAAKETP